MVARKGNLIYEHEEKFDLPFSDFKEIVTAQPY
jgi:hypothetical protein